MKTLIFVITSLISISLYSLPCGTTYPSLSKESLIVSQLPSNEFNIWSQEERFNLTFCVSGNFAKERERIVRISQEAAEAWMAHGNFKFIFVNDAKKCRSNQETVFSIVRVNRRSPYIMKAFFPSHSVAQRKILVNERIFTSTDERVRGIMIHEFGHVLGFRHEHAHPENTKCKEKGPFKPVTDYDEASIMNYLMCGGTNNIELSELDKIGVAKVYP